MKLFNEQKYMDACPAGKHIFSILPNGVVVPCNLLAYAKNNINNYPNIFSIDNLEELLLEYREKNDAENMVRIDRYCNSCPYVNKCGGGCKAVSVSLFNGASHPDQLGEGYNK